MNDTTPINMDSKDRKEKSLGTLSQKFVALFMNNKVIDVPN